MKAFLSILMFLILIGTPKSSFAFVYTPINSLYVQDSLKASTLQSKGDKIAHWGQKSAVTGAVLFTFAILLVGLVEFEMRGGFLLLLLYGSFGLGPILGLLGLILCLTALTRKDTTSSGRRKARTGLFALIFGVIASIVLAALLLN